jgi:c(7)-type cytochrome triheme protein
MKKVFVLLVLLVVFVGVIYAETGVKKKRPLPYEYGRVVINNHSEKAGLAPVVFDHWVHRANFTCRVCHVDITFAMKAGETNIRAIDNMKGFFCGTCHDGKTAYADRKVFEACKKQEEAGDAKHCDRCHSLDKDIKREHDFEDFKAKLPKERFGNGINWEEAEARELIKPANFIRGVSFKRLSFGVQKDFSLEPKVEGMPEIIFSHTKHTVWNGCEVCHPMIFRGVKKGLSKYSMIEIIEGKYCGVCHGTVAFPLLDCQRCHAKQVEMSS